MCIYLQSHHRPREGPFELNDVFAIINAVPAISLLSYGLFNKGLVPGLCFGAVSPCPNQKTSPLNRRSFVPRKWNRDFFLSNLHRHVSKNLKENCRLHYVAWCWWREERSWESVFTFWHVSNFSFIYLYIFAGTRNNSVWHGLHVCPRRPCPPSIPCRTHRQRPLSTKSSFGPPSKSYTPPTSWNQNSQFISLFINYQEIFICNFLYVDCSFITLTNLMEFHTGCSWDPWSVPFSFWI